MYVCYNKGSRIYKEKLKADCPQSFQYSTSVFTFLYERARFRLSLVAFLLVSAPFISFLILYRCSCRIGRKPLGIGD